MSRTILLEEYHLTVRAPRGLPESQYDAMRQALDDARFQTGLRCVVRDFFRQYTALAWARVSLTR